MKNKVFLLTFILCVSGILTASLNAQCPMCRMTLESNYQNGGSLGNGINAGILYLLVMPYIIVGAIAYVYIKNRKKQKKTELEDAFGEWKSGN